MPYNKGFGSDNHSGVHPDILNSLHTVNEGHHHSYGGDPWTLKCRELFSNLFEQDVSAYFVFNGTAANVLSLKAMCQSFHSVICSDVSHLNNDECGSPEFIAGCKLVPIKSHHGKITAEQIEHSILRRGDQHHSQVKAISITQPTELGTVYSLEEMKSIAAVAKKHSLYFHVDGARLVHAVHSLKTSFSSLIKETRVDVLSFGGTKNGLLFGEAVIFLNRNLDKDFKYIRKQGLQLPSKSKFLAIQFITLLEGELWRQIVDHSQNMAQYLKRRLEEIGLSPDYPVQANSVFIKISKTWLKPLRQNHFFYVWDERTFQVRLMTTYDTSKEQIDQFIQSLEEQKCISTPPSNIMTTST